MVIDNASKMDYARHNFRPLKGQLLRKYSPAETHFENLLLESNYYFVREKTNFKYNTPWCYYDFYLPFYRIYIEIDGESHNNEQQKLKDEEKYKVIKRKNRYLVRLKNEEVLCMKEFSMEYIIHVLCLQETERRKGASKPKKRVFKPEHYLKNLVENTESGLSDMVNDTGIFFNLNKPVFMFCKRIGKIFKFRNIGILKINIQFGLSEIYDNITRGDDAQKRNLQYIYAYTQEKCIDMVRRFMHIELEYDENIQLSCERSEIEMICCGQNLFDVESFKTK